ncbi:MAG: hypothetical protein ABFS46_03950, partial [Myxococcota bacterium]
WRWFLASLRPSLDDVASKPYWSGGANEPRGSSGLSLVWAVFPVLLAAMPNPEDPDSVNVGFVLRNA